MVAEGRDFWVFAYGSLMWRPGFSFVERHPALIHGFRRRLCILSDHYRGTAEKPGLVLGLDAGGACRGVAYRVCAADSVGTHEYLRARELFGGVYDEQWHPVELDDSRRIEALCYVAKTDHPRYAKELPREEVLALVRQGVGTMGPDTEYVLATHDHLVEMGVSDGELAWLAERLRDEA